MTEPATATIETPTETTTPKEPTAFEKLQAEYNQLVGLYGHNLAQQMQLREEAERLQTRIIKTMKKAANVQKGLKDEDDDSN